MQQQTVCSTVCSEHDKQELQSRSQSCPSLCVLAPIRTHEEAERWPTPDFPKPLLAVPRCPHGAYGRFKGKTNPTAGEATGRKSKERSQPCLLPTRISFILHVLLIARTLVLLKKSIHCGAGGGGGREKKKKETNLNNKVKHFFCYFRIGHAKFKPFSKKSEKNVIL